MYESNTNITNKIFKSFIMKESKLKQGYYEIQELNYPISVFFKSVFNQPIKNVVKLNIHFLRNVNEFDSS